jgi:hypothetical protein
MRGPDNPSTEASTSNTTTTGEAPKETSNGTVGEEEVMNTSAANILVFHALTVLVAATFGAFIGVVA